MMMLNLRYKPMLMGLFLLFTFSNSFTQSNGATTIDLQKARIIIEGLDRQFSTHYFNADSTAIYAMYAKGATFGNLKGDEILLSWGRQIRNAIKNDTRNLIFTTTSLSSDEEFLVELGIYELKDSKGI